MKILKKIILFVDILFCLGILFYLNSFPLSYSEKLFCILIGVFLALILSIVILVEKKIKKKSDNIDIHVLPGEEKNIIIEKKRRSYYGWLILIALVLGFSLPFHYVPSTLMMFPKENLTFSNTIITQGDIDALIKRHNECNNIFQTLPIRNEPLLRKLMEHGLIVEKKSNESDNNSQTTQPSYQENNSTNSQNNKEINTPKEQSKSSCKYQQASEKILTSTDVSNLTKTELKIMRNEIYARHGYIFKTSDLKLYFESQSWYTPRYSDVTSLLTSLEKSNIEFIRRYE